MRLIPIFSTHPLSAALAAAFGLVIPAAGTSAIEPNVSTFMVVTSCADSGAGSLRDVIGQAPSGTTIDLSQLPCSDSTITLTSGAIPIGDNRVLDITGVAPARGHPALSIGQRATIDGNHNSRIFDHTGTGDFTLGGVILRNGYTQGFGGCVRSNGDVMMYSTTITGCTANAVNYSGGGGGILVASKLTMEYSSVSGNTVTGNSFFSGGGIYAGSVDISGSTVADNVAAGAGGGLVVPGSASISYSTISGNHAGSIGGATLGLQDDSVVSIANSTISGNQASGIGGVLVLHGATIASTTIAFNIATTNGAGGLAIGTPSTVESTVVANNSAASAPSDIAGQCGVVVCSPPVSGANNLIMASLVPVPSDTLTDDPMLMPLANYGGSTQTHAIAPGSPAIDHGNNVGNGTGAFMFDQRGNGYLRAVGASADIGAFEYDPGRDRIFANGFDIEA